MTDNAIRIGNECEKSEEKKDVCTNHTHTKTNTHRHEDTHVHIHTGTDTYMHERGLAQTYTHIFSKEAIYLFFIY